LPSGARHETLAAAEPLTRASLYDLALPLTDENGQARELDAFRGHPVVISMFYSSCPYACPTLISQIQQLERSLSDQQRRDVRVLLVSFDPERDTPAKLKALSQERRIDESRWLLARASQDKLRELAAVLGIKYKRLDDGAFNHSSVITVLDRNGFVRARSDGLGRTLDESLRTTLAALAQG
jgi:protein SCO1/2